MAGPLSSRPLAGRWSWPFARESWNPMRYDPLRDPRPEKWLELDEADRMELVRVYHKRQRIRLPNALLHAAIHVTVENHIALGDELPVKAKLDELMKEGLDRHDALHAIGSVLAEHLFHLMKGTIEDEDPNPEYFRALGRLTARSRIESYTSEDGP